MSSRENAGSPDVETRMVGIELTIFLQYNWHIYQYLFGGFTYTYGDLLESLQHRKKIFIQKNPPEQNIF